MTTELQTVREAFTRHRERISAHRLDAAAILAAQGGKAEGCGDLRLDEVQPCRETFSTALRLREGDRSQLCAALGLMDEDVRDSWWEGDALELQDVCDASSLDPYSVVIALERSASFVSDVRFFMYDQASPLYECWIVSGELRVCALGQSVAVGVAASLEALVDQTPGDAALRAYYCEELFASFPYRLDSWFHQAAPAFPGQREQQRESAERVVQRLRELGRPHALLEARLAFENGRHEEVIRLMEVPLRASSGAGLHWIHDLLSKVGRRYLEAGHASVAHALLAMVLRAEGRPERRQLVAAHLARAKYADACEVLYGAPPGSHAPSEPPSETARARARELLDEVLAALEAESIPVGPLHAASHVVLGSIHLLDEEWDAALVSADAALAIEDSARAHSARAMALARLQRLEEAREAAALALALDPEDGQASFVAASIAARLGAPREAVLAHLVRAAERLPTFREALKASEALRGFEGAPELSGTAGD